MQPDIDRLMTAYQHGHVSRRVFLGSLAALTVAGCSADESASTSATSADAVAPSAPAQTGPPDSGHLHQSHDAQRVGPGAFARVVSGAVRHADRGASGRHGGAQGRGRPPVHGVGRRRERHPTHYPPVSRGRQFRRRAYRADSCRARCRGDGPVRSDAVARQDAWRRVRWCTGRHAGAVLRRP